MANPFRNPVLARAFDTLLASHATRSPGLFLPDGSPRRGGRPKLFPGGARSCRVTLDAQTIAQLREVGAGNLSAGIRIVAGWLRAAGPDSVG